MKLLLMLLISICFIGYDFAQVLDTSKPITRKSLENALHAILHRKNPEEIAPQIESEHLVSVVSEQGVVEKVDDNPSILYAYVNTHTDQAWNEVDKLMNWLAHGVYK